jgi:hypothetical protein
MKKEYWENRYASGGTSGCGSIGKLKEWEWKAITEYLPTPDHIIDVGCGDLSFWDGVMTAKTIQVSIYQKP